MKKIILIFITTFITISCKTFDIVPDYTSNYIGTFTETKLFSNGSISITEQKTVYEITFSKKDNNTMSMSYSEIHTEKNAGRLVTSKTLFSFQNIKVDAKAITINEIIKRSFTGIPDSYDILYTGSGTLNQSSLILEINTEYKGQKGNAENFTLLKK